MGKTISGYDVTVRGTYMSNDGQKKTIRVFGPVTFFLPDVVEIPNGKKRFETKMPDGRLRVHYEPQTAKRSVTTENVALYVVQRRLLPQWLSDKHPDAVSFRTCSIVPGGMKRVSRPENEAVILDKPVDKMSLLELKAFAKLRDLNVPLEAMTDLASAREMVRLELEAKTGKPALGDGAAEMAAAPGVQEAHGPVADGEDVPTDQQDPAASLI